MDNRKEFIHNYIESIKSNLVSSELIKNLTEFNELLKSTKLNGDRCFFLGNGASASLASHASVDFSKQAGLLSMNFNEANIITCYSNDYGYEHWMKKALEKYQQKGDIVCLISVSGESPSILNCAKYAKEIDLSLVTFSGCEESNSLKGYGDINFWVDSKAYNIVESVHCFWLTMSIDLLIGKSVYKVS
jgi:D-sedoheptulose 7-phosphate isomerase